MSESEVICAAIEGFYEFCGEVHSTRYRCDSVEEVVASWLTDGRAVEDCRCNYTVFLSAVACIFAEAHDKQYLSGKEDGVFSSRTVNVRYVPEAIDANDPFAHAKQVANIFDPYVFIAAVEEYRFRLAYGR